MSFSEEATGSLAGVLPTGSDALIHATLPANPLSHLPSVVVPRPTLIPRDAPPDRAALLVVRAYLGALGAARLTTRAWFPYRVGESVLPDITKAKGYAELCKLAAAFTAHDISPFAWAAWRLEVMQHGKAKADFKVPTLFALMALGWLEEKGRRGWFRSTLDKYKGGAVETSATRTLRERWDTMLSEVYAARPSGPQGVETIRAIFAEHFPGDTLSVLTDRARAQIESMQAHYARKAEEGAWLW
jgi:hypothetical protein